MKKIIGIAGRICCGKDTVAERLVRIYAAERIAASDPLYATLRLFGIPESRYGSQIVSTFVRTHFGEDILERELLRRIELSDKKLVIATSIRRKEDIALLRTRFDFHLLFINSPQDMRYRWYAKRNKGLGDYGKSFEEFCERDAYETEKTIDSLRDSTDHCLENTGSLEELFSALDQMCVKLQLNNDHTSVSGEIARH